MPRININGIEQEVTEEQLQQYKVTDAEEFELSMSRLRSERNSKLAETDYLALSDQTLSADMTTYRQELRDITNGITTVEEANAVVFPTKP